MSAATGRYQIRNPATRQGVDLPDPHPITLSMLAALDWRSRECKLLARYSVGEEDSIEYKWEILNVGTDEHWRALNWGEEEDVSSDVTYLENNLLSLLFGCNQIC
ncbi:hypothetical protein L484_014844 [Morus notabilis]|uniref:Uncharacterized protein n=1 Tax=Morus notabilis TaxID=981085 RepID=W9QM26_9ROSA|nr:hypothetical protein L484_014844 [Morus notabilis]